MFDHATTMSSGMDAGDKAGKIPVLLLKTKSVPNDGYEEYFTAGERFEPKFVPVLEHKHNKESLNLVKELLRSGDIDVERKEARYGGLIFTSQRAVEGFMSVAEELRGNNQLSINLFQIGRIKQ